MNAIKEVLKDVDFKSLDISRPITITIFDEKYIMKDGTFINEDAVVESAFPSELKLNRSMQGEYNDDNAEAVIAGYRETCSYEWAGNITFNGELTTLLNGCMVHDEIFVRNYDTFCFNKMHYYNKFYDYILLGCKIAFMWKSLLTEIGVETKTIININDIHPNLFKVIKTAWERLIKMECLMMAEEGFYKQSGNEDE